MLQQDHPCHQRVLREIHKIRDKNSSFPGHKEIPNLTIFFRMLIKTKKISKIIIRAFMQERAQHRFRFPGEHNNPDIDGADRDNDKFCRVITYLINSGDITNSNRGLR